MIRVPAPSAIVIALLAPGTLSCVLEGAEGVKPQRRMVDSGSPGGGSGDTSVTAGTTTTSVGSMTNVPVGSASASGTGGTAGTTGAGGSGGGPGTADAGPMSDGSMGVPDAGGAPKLSTQVVPILKAACAVSGCHDAIKKEHG